MIEIRTATESDAETLFQIAQKTFLDTFAKENRQEDIDLYVAQTFGFDKQLREIQDPNRRISIAWAGDDAAGFLHLVNSLPDPSVTGPRPIEILRLYVDSRFHGKGVGASLMDEAMKIAKKEGYQTLWLGVWERNFRAQAFYKKYGFTVVGEHIFKLGTDDQLDHVMARAVDAQG